jgi:hypothetical protein
MEKDQACRNMSALLESVNLILLSNQVVGQVFIHFVQLTNSSSSLETGEMSHFIVS